jgi:hypothetical protein
LSPKKTLSNYRCRTGVARGHSERFCASTVSMKAAGPNPVRRSTSKQGYHPARNGTIATQQISGRNGAYRQKLRMGVNTTATDPVLEQAIFPWTVRCAYLVCRMASTIAAIRFLPLEQAWTSSWVSAT